MSFALISVILKKISTCRLAILLSFLTVGLSGCNALLKSGGLAVCSMTTPAVPETVFSESVYSDVTSPTTTCTTCHAGGANAAATTYIYPNPAQSYSFLKGILNPLSSAPDVTFGGRTTDGHCGNSLCTPGSKLNQDISSWVQAEVSYNEYTTQYASMCTTPTGGSNLTYVSAGSVTISAAALASGLTTLPGSAVVLNFPLADAGQIGTSINVTLTRTANTVVSASGALTTPGAYEISNLQLISTTPLKINGLQFTMSNSGNTTTVVDNDFATTSYTLAAATTSPVTLTSSTSSIASLGTSGDILGLGISFTSGAATSPVTTPPPTTTPPADLALFTSSVIPILTAGNCQSCHSPTQGNGFIYSTTLTATQNRTNVLNELNLGANVATSPLFENAELDTGNEHPGGKIISAANAALIVTWANTVTSP